MPSLERTEAEALASAVTLRSIASPSSEVGSCAVAPVSADGEEPRYASLPVPARSLSSSPAIDLPASASEPSTTMDTCVSERASAACAARNALVHSSRSTISEICRSDEPCAMARMLTPAVAIAFVKVAPVPGRKAIPSPMTATIDLSSSIEMPEILMFSVASSSRKNSARTASSARPASDSWMPRQMEESADACEIISTATRSRCSTEKRRDDISTDGIRPVPCTLRIATESTEVTPLIGAELSPSGTGHAALRSCLRAVFTSPAQPSDEVSSEQARPVMTVPGWAGLNMLRT
mmetsp:Transcript_2576/g.8380  ORF Transcript_2576/g.8380 Transcript_2576/m.8380 type:complete len:294 (-) Transcript_2576:1172-2053(-)